MSEVTYPTNDAADVGEAIVTRKAAFLLAQAGRAKSELKVPRPTGRRRLLILE
jgi:hypothetical protein